jgi:hypothetical protein
VTGRFGPGGSPGRCSGHSRPGIVARRLPWALHPGSGRCGLSDDRFPGWCSSCFARGDSSFVTNFKTHQIRANLDDIADLGSKPNDLSVDRRRDFHRRLVGHDRRENRVLSNHVADLDMPLNEFGFGDTFADVG